MSGGATTSEFDLRPSERKLSCGCYVEEINGVWRITGQAFLCPDRHEFHAGLAAEIVDRSAGKDNLPPKPPASYRETRDVAAATARLIRSVGKRVATEDPDGLLELQLLEEAVRGAWANAIAGLRRSGFTDRDLGRQLGMTRQAIEQRWPRREEAS